MDEESQENHPSSGVDEKRQTQGDQVIDLTFAPEWARKPPTGNFYANARGDDRGDRGADSRDHRRGPPRGGPDVAAAKMGTGLGADPMPAGAGPAHGSRARRRQPGSGSNVRRCFRRPMSKSVFCRNARTY